MVSKEEKERKAKLKQQFKNQEKTKFEQGLPMSRENFTNLFDYLDKCLEEENCDNTLRLSTDFLKQLNIEKIEEVKDWLNEHGGYCDCEVLANVEDEFEK
jgi:hypothetical protein